MDRAFSAEMQRADKLANRSGRMAEYLFVYGTLNPAQAPSEIAHVVRRLKPIGKGTIRARMHRFPEYPAIKIDGKNGPRLVGDVFQIPTASALRKLDEYEEYYPAALAKSLFQRKQIKVRLADGSTVPCWVYEYNRKLPDKKSFKSEAKVA